MRKVCTRMHTTHTPLKVYNKTKTKQVGLLNTLLFPKCKTCCFVNSSRVIVCLINTCDSTTVKRDESMTEAQNITHVSQCFSHVLHLVQPSLVDVKGAHSTVQKNSITHQQGVVITACMFGCASLRVRRVKCSLYSHVNCVLGGGGQW